MTDTTFLQAWLIVCGTIAFLGSLRFLRRYLELRQARQVPMALEGLQERLERIEATVESTALEVERMSEANRFIAKVIAERGGAPGLSGRQERVITPH